MPEATVTLSGRVSGLGLDPTDPASGSFVNNLPLRGASLVVHACDPSTGLRRGGALAQQQVGADGQWGPVTVPAGAPLEFEIRAPGYAVTHVYRGPFPRSSRVVHLRPERLSANEAGARALVVFTRPRGYFDARRDRLRLDGSERLPGLPPAGAGVSSIRLMLPSDEGRSIAGQCNAETVVGHVWPASQGDVTVLELSY